jgi:fatty acid desaturase
MSLAVYRERHFVHHRALGTQNDTKDVIFTSIRGKDFVRFAIDTLLGFRFIRMVKTYSKSQSGSRDWVHLVTLASVQLVILGAFTAVSHWSFYFIFWMLPFVTVLQFFAALRAIVEHQPRPSEGPHPFTRRLDPTWMDRLLFCRAGFDYHWIHHDYPGVPFFNLGLVERELFPKQNDTYPTYQQTIRALVTRT